MGKCDNPGCDGHLGKFPDCIAEALWGIDQDDQTGTTDWEAWYALYRFDQAETHPVHVYAPNLTVTIPAATYIAGEDDRGAVFYTGYTDPAAARQAWDDINARYAEWDVDE